MSTEADPSLQKKIHMIAAVLEPLKRAKKVAKSKEVAVLEETLDAAKTAFEAKEWERARKLGDRAGLQLKAAAQLMPKIPRKLVMIQINQILKY